MSRTALSQSILITVMLLTILAMAGCPSRTIVVANFIDMTQAAAELAITNAGLTVGTVTEQYSDAVAMGRVISQDPAAGSRVAPGSAVALVVSMGAQPVLTGTWLIELTAEDKADPTEECVYFQQWESANGTYIVYLDWRYEYSLWVEGTLDGSQLDLTGEGLLYGETQQFAASVIVDGDTMLGSYTVTGVDDEVGTFQATRGECMSTKAWVRQCRFQDGRYNLNFDTWDLIPDGPYLESVVVTGQGAEALQLDCERAEESRLCSLSLGLWLSEDQAPSAGDVYAFSAVYSDGSEKTVTAQVREQFVDFPLPLSPADGETVTEDSLVFEWAPPSCQCQGYYRVWVVDAAGEDVRSVYPDKDVTSVEYNYDATGQSLKPGETYEWRLIAFDPPTSGGPDNYAMASHTFTVEGEGEGKRSKWDW